MRKIGVSTMPRRILVEVHHIAADVLRTECDIGTIIFNKARGN
jgi:hypothetical protein